MARRKGSLGKKTIARMQASAAESKSDDVVAVLDAPAAPVIAPESPAEFHGKDVVNSACNPPADVVECPVEVDLVIEPVEKRELKVAATRSVKRKPGSIGSSGDDTDTPPPSSASDPSPPPEQKDPQPLVKKDVPKRDGPDHRYFAWLGRRTG